MRHYLFVNKYYSKLYSVDNEIKREFFNYNGEKIDVINNTGCLDVEKEDYILCPKESPFKVGYEHIFSIDNICGIPIDKEYFILDFLSQVFKMIDNLKDIVVVFSYGAVGELSMATLNKVLENSKEVKVTAIIKDLLFIGAITFLSIARKKSIALVSGFNITTCKIMGNDAKRGVDSIWEDPKDTIDNIKYLQGYSNLINDFEYQKAFDLALDSRLNYGTYDLIYETRDHKYKMDAHALDDYILRIKENIKEKVDKEVFYLFDISFPLIYDEFINQLGIDINKSDEVEEFYKYVLEYAEIIVKHNSNYYRIMSRKNKYTSVNDGYTEYDLEYLTDKKRKILVSMFKSKYLKEK